MKKRLLINLLLGFGLAGWLYIDGYIFQAVLAFASGYLSADCLEISLDQKG